MANRTSPSVRLGVVLFCTAALAACTKPTAPPPAPQAAASAQSQQRPAILDQRQVSEAEYLDVLPPKPAPKTKHPPVDHSGRKQAGKVSYYARKFDGRKMADGRRFNPQAPVAASKTLPLGTTAKVVNLKTGKSAVVTVQDRGPHVDGRVLDVSPKVAEQLDLKKSGVAPAVVKPIAVPQPNGGVKLGAGAAELPPKQVVQEVNKTKEIAGESAK